MSSCFPFLSLSYWIPRHRNKFYHIPFSVGIKNQGASWQSEGVLVLGTWDLQTLQCDGPPQQSTLSVMQTMVGLFNHRRTSVPAICLHTPTVQTLCCTNTHTHTHHCCQPLTRHTIAHEQTHKVHKSLTVSDGFSIVNHLVGAARIVSVLSGIFIGEKCRLVNV